MRTHLALAACVLVAAVPVAWAAGGSPMPSMPSPREQSPQEQAKSVYNDGIRDVRKADGFQADANQLTDAGKKDKALRKAHDHYASSQTKFLQAVKLDPNMYEAWNYVGYTSRKLGNYDVALAAYERALSLHPGLSGGAGVSRRGLPRVEADFRCATGLSRSVCRATAALRTSC